MAENTIAATVERIGLESEGFINPNMLKKPNVKKKAKSLFGNIAKKAVEQQE